MFESYFKRPVQELFPDHLKLTDLVLKELKLPTSIEQEGMKYRASYKSTDAFISAMDSGLNPIESKEVNAAVFEENLFCDIDIKRDFEILCEQEKSKVKIALYNLTQKYDRTLDGLQTKYPLLTDVMWQVFRRTGFVSSSFAHSALTSNPEENKKIKEGFKDLEKAGFKIESFETDKEFAEGYIFTEQRHLPRDIRTRLKLPLNLRLVEFDKDFMLGIGRYAFADRRNDIYQTIWNLQQEKAPRFNYQI